MTEQNSELGYNPLRIASSAIQGLGPPLERGPEGVWCTYLLDSAVMIQCIDVNLERLVRGMNPGEQIFYWPFGMNIHEAMARWQAEQEKVDNP